MSSPDKVPDMIFDSPTPILQFLDLAAAVAFAITGALVASRKQLDVLGFIWLAVITGVGGGTVRDLVLGVPVFWVVDPTPVVACMVTAVLVHFGAHLLESRYRFILFFDAFGMALVAVAGTAKGLDAGTSALVAVMMGVMTAALGGIIRDTFGQEPSIILRREIYVAAAVAGACAYVVMVQFGVDRVVAMGTSFVLAFVIRVLAVRYNWSLPAYRGREGRDMSGE
ncbi:trimeric intracellular cation channel family protein [uncultured Litoreibacter sp.]|uniref:trimeric intracellular cation channel family protein n=1 Tax=uncultured Litoreibacter sp. TaxID=1392394 RepID=UPI00262AFE85|nr:trimeric intracellular cation channel family protein [uncultured Litoreibacter sp.]